MQLASVSARPTSPVELGAALETRLLFDSALGGWHGLETLVGDRFAALDRQSVGPGSKSLFGAFDGLQLDSQVVGETLIQSVVVQLGRLSGHVLVGRRRFVALLWLEPAEALHDPLTLAGEQFTCALGIHALSVQPAAWGTKTLSCVSGSQFVLVDETSEQISSVRRTAEAGVAGVGFCCSGGWSASDRCGRCAL